MNKRLLSIALLCSATTFAQQVPNGGFESWVDQGAYEEPSQWATPNPLSILGAPISATKSTDHQEGSFSVKLENTLFDLDQDGTDDVIPGTAFIGTLDLFSQSILDGIGFTFKPDSLYGWTKYSPFDNNDALSVQVTLSKWNALNEERDIIGQGTYDSGLATSTFEKFELAIDYLSTDTPDTLSIFIFGTNNQAAAIGTILWADDFSFTYSSQASVAETKVDYFKVYPIPTNDILHIRSDKSESIQIVDLAGNVVETATIVKGIETVMNIESFDQGIYFIKRSGGETTKFIVTK